MPNSKLRAAAVLGPMSYHKAGYNSSGEKPCFSLNFSLKLPVHIRPCALYIVGSSKKVEIMVLPKSLPNKR